MRLEDDPTVKRLPSERMRKQFAKLIVRENLKLQAKIKKENEKRPHQ